MTHSELSRITKGWIRNKADEIAFDSGMRFDEKRGRFVCDWIERFCYLYEGEAAGQRIVLLDYWRDYIMRLFGWVRYSKEWDGWIRRFTHASCFIAKKNGKALCLETEVPTPQGFKRFGDLVVGDEVYDENGRPCRIINQTEVWDDRPCYKVVFSDGTEVVADANHLWTVQAFDRFYTSVTLSTNYMSESVYIGKHSNYRIPVCDKFEASLRPGVKRYRYIISITPTKSVPVRCITVDSPSQQFLITRSYIATHNSPMCAAINLYLLCADGEKGQKIYQAAKNGDQAKIAQRHAVEMVRQSPELSRVCKIHNSTLLIQHAPTRSMLMVLTGDDHRGAKTKEGLNGSVAFDEMHVVDREMYERVSRAGISRREPLVLSYSTAGDDLSSVGYERARYGRQVNSGDRIDSTFLHVEYGVSVPGVSEASIDANLVDFGKQANPAWGTLVKESEFVADWQRSKGNPREVARFKQYRLNMWVGSTYQWLDLSGWEKGAKEFTLDDLRGQDCYGALDLSRTRDMTAFVLMFPEGETEDEIVMWPMFWLPKARAAALDHLYPYRSWANNGYITITPGDVVDYNAVKADIRQLLKDYKLNLLSLCYDPKYAEEITQQLVDGETGAEGLGCERIPFAQSLMHFTGPAKEFERRVSIGAIIHPNNAVMNWQVGHTEVYTDSNNNIRPVKPGVDTGKSIDGVVAAIMATSECMISENDPGVHIL